MNAARSSAASTSTHCPAASYGRDRRAAETAKVLKGMLERCFVLSLLFPSPPLSLAPRRLVPLLAPSCPIPHSAPSLFHLHSALLHAFFLLLSRSFLAPVRGISISRHDNVRSGCDSNVHAASNIGGRRVFSVASGLTVPFRSSAACRPQCFAPLRWGCVPAACFVAVRCTPALFVPLVTCWFGLCAFPGFIRSAS